MSWAVSLLARSENLLECLLARKRKSGPSRYGDALAFFLSVTLFARQ